MNKFLVAGASLALLAGTPAMAADMPIKVPPPVVVTGWTGGYFGFGVGGEWSRDRWTANCITSAVGSSVTCAPNALNNFVLDATNPHTFHTSGVRGEVHAGYQMQFGSWVLGSEIQVGLADAKSTFNGIVGCTIVGGPCNSGAAFFATPGLDRTQVRLLADGAWLWRGGFVVWPDLLIYGTGGFAIQEIKTNIQCNNLGLACLAPFSPTPGAVFNADEHFVKPGWTIGVGGEYKWGHWVARAEYRYSDFGHINVLAFANPTAGAPPVLPPPGEAMNSSLHVRTQMATVGLGWLFWTDAAPVRARY
jgi:outer membrane immunogenic protein